MRSNARPKKRKRRSQMTRVYAFALAVLVCVVGSGCGPILYPFNQETTLSLERAPYSMEVSSPPRAAAQPQDTRMLDGDLMTALPPGQTPPGVKLSGLGGAGNEYIGSDSRTYRYVDGTWYVRGLGSARQTQPGPATATSADRGDPFVLRATCRQATLGNGPSPTECSEALQRLEGNEKFATACAANMSLSGCAEFMRGLKPSDAPDSPFNRNQRWGAGLGGRQGRFRPFNAADINRWNGY